MRITTTQGVTLEYETFGTPTDPAVLLVAGFGSQLIGWPAGFCERIAAGGRFVIAFDNRDCGLSTKFDGQGRAYTINAMAEDGWELLTALGVEHAHIVGSSMGGMIAQIMAIEHPERALTLTSMMSTTGEPEYGQSEPEALQALLAPAPPDRDGYIDASTNKSLTWASLRYRDVAAIRALAGQSYDRSFSPEGTARQLAAMIAGGSRADGLRSLRVPTLVIHGLDDTLVAPSGGERTAALVPGARLLLVEDMSHDRPAPLWPQLCGAIVEHTAAQPHPKG
jgi:pimeloyl-ACP methyl ester carboxylesterase